jgi:hypothetical protein
MGSIDDYKDILKNFKENIPREVRSQIDPTAHENILNKLGASYPNSKRALKEYISNSLDEKLRKSISTSIDVKILVSKQYGAIMIDDNAQGMSPDKLAYQILHAGISDKVLDPNTIGNMGIGLQAFRNFATEMHVFTKTEKDPMYTYAQISKYQPEKTKMPRIKEQDLKRLEADILPAAGILPPFSHGTRTFLMGINPKIINDNFTPGKLNEFFGEEYAPLLSDDEIKISVGYAGAKQSRLSDIISKQFDGESICDNSMDVALPDGKKGKIHLYLFYNPKGGPSNKIGIYVCGTKVQDITDINEFNNTPWNRGKLNGWINTNILDVSLNRNNVIVDWKDPKFMRFYQTLKENEKEINDRLETKRKEYKTDTSTKVIEHILDILGPIARAVLSRKTFVKTPPGATPDLTGKMIPTGTVVTAPPWEFPKKKGKKIKKKEVTPTGNTIPGQELNPAEGGLETEVREDGWKGFKRPSYDVVSFNVNDRDKRSRHSYIENRLHVEINDIHEDYEKEVENDPLGENSQLYHANLFCKEVACAEIEDKIKDVKDPIIINQALHLLTELYSQMSIKAKNQIKSSKALKEEKN